MLVLGVDRLRTTQNFFSFLYMDVAALRGSKARVGAFVGVQSASSIGCH